jgi:hypothetical protein
MSTLSITSKAVAFGDPTATNNPSRRNFDWSRQYTVSVANPRSFHETIEAGTSKTIFSSTRSTSLDGTSAFSSAASALGGGRYRFTWTGGTNPGLRTDRALTLTGQAVTVTVNADQSANLSLGAGTFGATAVNDIVFIPDVTTGDSASVFNVANVGFWQVIAVLSSTNIQVQRLSGEAFVATGETVTLASNGQLQAFSASGVQAGDKATISAGFAAVTQKTFTVAQVTSTWFEVVSTTAIPAEAGKLPGSAGLVFYPGAKTFLRVEADQECVVQLNGDSGTSIRVSPVAAGDTEQVGWFEKYGPVWSLVVINKAAATLSIDVFSAE